MAISSNKFATLEDEGDADVSFKITEVVEGAMQLVPDREGGNRQLVGDIVKTVVAALLPMVQSIAHQLVSSPQVSVQKVQATVQNHDNRLDEVEQYSRRDNIIMRGVPENDGESTNAVVIGVAASAGVVVSEADISTSHRVGRHQPNKMRPIVARFVRRDLRTQFLRSRGQGQVIQQGGAANSQWVRDTAGFVDQPFQPNEAPGPKNMPANISVDSPPVEYFDLFWDGKGLLLKRTTRQPC